MKKPGEENLVTQIFNRRGRRETNKINTTFGNIILSDVFRQFRQTVLFRIISLCFVLFLFHEMTLSHNIKFREMDYLFREITKLVLLQFREIAKQNFIG